MALNKISAGQLNTADGAGFFSNGVNKPGDAIRHPNRTMEGLSYQHNLATDGNVTGGSWLQSFTTDGSISPVVGWDYFEDIAWEARVADRYIARTTANSTSGGAGDTITSANLMLNNLAGTDQGWAGYFDAVKAVTGAGTTVSIEVEIANLPGASPMGGVTPYNPFVSGMVRGIGLSAGSDKNVFGRSYAIDALLTLNSNGGSAHAGIVFRANALLREGSADDTTEMTVPTNGYAKAISLAHEQGLSWYSQDPVSTAGTQAEVVRLYSEVTDPDVRWRQVFADAAWTLQDGVTPGSSQFKVDYIPTAANYVTVVPAAAGSAVTVEARGADTNINLSLKPKGTGIAHIPIGNVPNYANDAAAAAGGVAVGGFYRNGSVLMIRVT